MQGRDGQFNVLRHRRKGEGGTSTQPADGVGEDRASGMAHWHSEDDYLGKDAQRTSQNDGASVVKGAKQRAAGHDPLRWFGVLVPPPLRSCQHHFMAGETLAMKSAA